MACLGARAAGLLVALLAAAGGLEAVVAAAGFAFACGRVELHGEADAFTAHVYFQHFDFDDLPSFNDFACVFHKLVCQLAHVYQPVLVYAQIHKRAKGGYVADCAFKHHAFLQVGNVFYAFVKAGYDKVGTRVAAGFFELGQDVFYGDNAKLGAGKLLGLELFEHFGIVFNDLFALTNMPIQRFGSTLVSKGTFETYMALLQHSFQADNLAGVMCRTTVSVDWQGWLSDCDFNQQLGLPLGTSGVRRHLRDLLSITLQDQPIRVAGHCFGCTAGQGSSCGGAL